MQPSSGPFVPIAVLLAALSSPVLPAAEARAQEREIISHTISTSSLEQILTLGFNDGTEISIAFADGTVAFNGDVIGRYEPGGDAFRSWSDLLSGIPETAPNQALADWNPGGASSGAEAELLARIDRLLEQTLAGEMESAAAGTLQARPSDIARRMEEAREAGREVGLAERARVLAEVVQTQAVQETQREMRARIRELEAELERRERAANRPQPWERAFREVARTTGDILDALLKFLLACGAALLLTRYAGHRVERVAREAADRPLRSMAVGFAGGILFVPALVLGIVALAVTLIGLFLVPFWVFLFPLLVFLAGFLGYVGVSQNVGRWVLDQNLPWLDRVDRTRATHVRLTGLAALALPFAAAPLLSAIPLAGWLGGVLHVVGSLVSAFAMMAGLGATILTRGGGEGPLWRGDPVDEELEAAWSPDDIGNEGTGDEPSPKNRTGGNDESEARS